MSDWEYEVETSDVKAWEKESRTLQQNMFLRLGDREWDEWDKSDETILPQKVGFGLYPLPDNNPDSYTKTQREIIKLVADVLLKNARSGSIINFACIFIFGKIKNDKYFTSLFKVKGKQNQTLFIDTNGSVYESWREYLNSNRLPKCMYCYPRDGLYQGENNQVLIDFGTSPACNPKSGTFSIDITPTVVTFGSSFMMNSLFPAPITTIPEMIETSSASIGMHDIALSGTDLGNAQLYDIEWMKEMALNISESRARTTITQAAAAGDINTKKQIIVQPVNAVVLKDFKSLVEKANKGTPTKLDVLHFSEYFLFYSNKILKKKTVREIIENTQKQVLNRFCDKLTDQQTGEFIKLVVEGESNIRRNAHKIKAINQISNPSDFFDSLYTVRSDLESHQVQFSFEEPGLVSIDGELHIAPIKFVQISEMDRRVILDFTRKKNDSTTNISVDLKKIEKILSENRVKMQSQRRETIAQLKKAFNKDKLEMIKIGNEQIFKNMKPSELDRLAKVMKDSCKNYDPDILKIANEFAKMRRCKSPLDYCNYVEFVVKYVNDLKSQKEKIYKQALEVARVKPGFVINTFDQEYGIKGKRAVHFLNEVINSFYPNCKEHKENFNALDQQYTNIENVVLPLNEKADPSFISNSSTVYHFFKHSDFGSTQLTAEQYFEIASELVNEPLNKRKTQLNQQGDKIIITFSNRINGATGIVFENIIDGTQSLATVYYDKKVLNQ